MSAQQSSAARCSSAHDQSVQGREIPDEHGSAQHPVAACLGDQLCGRRVDIGCGDENFAERRGTDGDVGHGLHPEHECLPRVGLGQDRLDRRAVGTSLLNTIFAAAVTAYLTAHLAAAGLIGRRR